MSLRRPVLILGKVERWAARARGIPKHRQQIDEADVQPFSHPLDLAGHRRGSRRLPEFGRVGDVDDHECAALVASRLHPPQAGLERPNLARGRQRPDPGRRVRRLRLEPGPSPIPTLRQQGQRGGAAP